MFTFPAGHFAPQAGGGAPPTTYLQDAFTGTNGTALGSHSMNTGSGWTVHSGTMQIQSNKLNVSGSGFNLATADAGQANASGSVKYTASVIGSGLTGTLVGRQSDSNNYIAIGVNLTGLDLYTIAGGSYTSRASTGFTVSEGSTYTIALTCNGTSISSTVDGGNALNYTTDFNQSATRWGVRSFVGSGGANANYDDFLVTSV